MGFGNGNGNGDERNESGASNPDEVGVRYRRKQPIDVNVVEVIEPERDHEGNAKGDYRVKSFGEDSFSDVSPDEFENTFERVA